MFQGKALLEQKLYVAGLIFAALSVTGIALLIFIPLNPSYIVPQCQFNMLTGLYCPGCGGTRAAIAFFSGHWLKSFLYHPFVPYCGILYIAFMVKGTLAVLAKEKFQYMKFRNGYIFFGIAILLIQFAVKNVLLLVYGIDWLQNISI